MQIIFLIVTLFMGALFVVSKFGKKPCSWCSNNDFLSGHKLCRNCTLISKEVKKRKNLIRESYEIIKKTKKLETQLSRINTIFDHINALKIHYDKGVHFTSFSLEAFIKEAETKRDVVLTEMSKVILDHTFVRVDSLHDPEQKIKLFAEAREEIRQLGSLSDEQSILRNVDIKLKDLSLKTELTIYLDNASKMELKKDNEQALEKYYDVLLFFRKKWPGNIKEKKIIEEKIIALGGNLN